MSLIPTILLIISSATVWTQNTTEEENPFGISLEASKYCPFNASDPFRYNTWNYTRVVVNKLYKQSVNGNTFLIIKLNGDCYSNVSKINGKGLPVVVTDLDENNPLWRKYPKCGEWKEQEWGLIEDNEYQFPTDADYSGSYWKNGNVQGFNTEWLGCPQDMCLNAKVDTIVDRTIYRGRYVWDFSDHRLKNVEPVSTKFENKLIDGYFSANYRDHDDIAIITKKNRFWFHNQSTSFNPNDSIGLPLEDIFGQSFTSYDFHSIYSEPSEDVVYYFKNGQYMTGQFCSFNCKKINQTFTPVEGYSQWVSVTALNPGFPNKVDDIFKDVMNQVAYFFLLSDWSYYAIPIQQGQFEPAVKNYKFKPESIFNALFGCPDESYEWKGYEGFHHFLELFANHTDETDPITTPVSTIGTTIVTTIGSTIGTTIGSTIGTTVTAKEKGIDWILIAYIVIVLVLIAVVLMISYYIFCRKVKPRVSPVNPIDRQTIEENPPNLVSTEEEPKQLPPGDPKSTSDRPSNPLTQPPVVVPSPTKPSDESNVSKTSQTSALTSDQTPDHTLSGVSTVRQPSDAQQSSQT